MATVPAPAPPPTVYRFTVEQYHRMIETGILTGDDRVELIHGRIVPKMPHNPPHDQSITRINRLLIRLLPDEWLLRVQCAITLQDSEPEPDFAIVRGPEERYQGRHPAPRDVALLIEVADSTLLQNRLEKGPLYAQFRIPQYWIVNLVDSQVEVYTLPRAGKASSYRERRDYLPGDSIPLVLQGQDLGLLAVRDLLSASAAK
jgi:Uma2 family endonuclease